MAIKLEAHVEVTHDGGYEFYDRMGVVTVRVDGDVLKSQPEAIKLSRIKEATEYLAPLYSIELPDALKITVLSWQISSVQQGDASLLLDASDA